MWTVLANECSGPGEKSKGLAHDEALLAEPGLDDPRLSGMQRPAPASLALTNGTMNPSDSLPPRRHFTSGL